MKVFVGVVLAILAFVFSFPSSIVSHANGFARIGGVVASHSPTIQSEFQPERRMANDNQNPQYPQPNLDDVILAAAKKASSGVTRWQGDPFYPSRDDLTSIVLVKLCSIQPQLESIWNDPDPDSGGFIGLLRFATTVAKHAAIDERRRNQSRTPEILAVRLDEPIRNDDGEAVTRADLVSDADGTFQAFQFDDLRSELTDQEYAVLQASLVNGATQHELAEEIGTSDSSISRTYIRAKEKAQKWIRWLRDRTDKQVRASIHPTFTRRPCLRPNGIAPETLDRWNATDSKSMRVVPFHDEASEWRPPITKQRHVRARKECWNAACQATPVGPDNLILPDTQRSQAVRFMPSYTGHDNRLCDSCEKAAARGVQKIRNMERGRNMHTPHLFGSDALHESSNAEGNSMDRKQAKELIQKHDIPRSTVANLSGVWLSDLSGWLNSRSELSEDKIERIAQVISDIVKAVEVMPLKINLSDVENVRKLIVAVTDAERQMDLFAPLDLPGDFELGTGTASGTAA
jgi:RNA polymerase sigma factor (sigma-70 family)